MKRYKKYIGTLTTLAMLLAVGCQRADVIDETEPEPNTGELQFYANLAEAHSASRSGESDNNVLRIASAAGGKTPHIVIETYKGTPGNSLEQYFSDELGYFEPDSYWDVNSGKARFLPSGGMNLYAYFATDFTAKGDLSNIDYAHPTTATEHPKLTFTVTADDALNQVDLIAAKVETITRSEVQIPFRHILSQINFGVQGIDLHQITISNIKINKVMGNGSFDFATWLWTPNTKTAIHTYPYYFPDRKEGEPTSGLGGNYKTQGTPDDAQNSYIFGDGGKFGPGKDAKFLYAQVVPSGSNYATQDKSALLHNSLMLLPQTITSNAEASVTFDYEITLDGQVVRSSKNNVVRLDGYYDWKPNMRYVYLFKFDDPSQKVVFEVLVDPWQNYNGGDGIVETEELNSSTLFEKYVRMLTPNKDYVVPIGTLTSDFICDWSLYTLDNSFTAGQSFSITFDNDLPFAKGKSVIIKAPFGFVASTSMLKKKGTVTFTASPRSYYATSTELNSAISSGVGNHDFCVSDAVKLSDIHFAGSATAESSLTLRYLMPYSGTPPSRWQLYKENIVVYFPNDFALTKDTPPYAYTVYTMAGLEKVFKWMNNGGANPGGSNSAQSPAERMQTNITLTTNGVYNLADAYASAADGSKPKFVPIGNSALPYTGIFDGKGATVSNLFINTISYSGDGFFGKITGTVQHLHLSNVSVNSGDWNVGGLVALNGGTIRGCSVGGTIRGGTNTGGIAGQNDGIIYSSYSTAAISGNGATGGIAGVNGATIQACYSTNNSINILGSGSTAYVKTCYYVAPSDIGTNQEGVITRVPSIAALNGKIADLNKVGGAQFTGAHFVSGDLNATPPSVLAGDPAVAAPGGVLKGTFIQNWFALYWDQNRWNEEMAILATLGMEYLVIDQVMEFSDFEGNKQYMSWYPASQGVLVNDNLLYINANKKALEMCMTACRAHGIRLFIGTFFDKRYWDEGKAVLNKQKWNNCITTVNRVMDELIKFYFNGASSTESDFTDVLAGWYFPYEVDDYNFQTPDAKAVLLDGMRTAMTHRNDVSNKPYLFSPFMNGSGKNAIKETTMNAAQYAALWGEIMTSTGFVAGDILSPQDCIGIEKLTISDLDSWMRALKGATPNGVKFWINIELFGPGGDVSFLTTQQIKTSKPLADKLISFSYPIYYSPNSDRKEGDHNAYKFYYDAQAPM